MSHTRELHVQKHGSGAGVPVVLVHGFTGNARAWRSVILEGLSQLGPVLAVDLPGHGSSPASGNPGDYRMDRVVALLVGVLETRGLTGAHLVGYSMGGRVALATAIRHPDRVTRLVLESSSPGLPTAAERARRREQDEALARKIEDRGMEWFVDHWMALPLFATQRRLPPEIRDEARRRRLDLDPGALAAVLRGLGTGSQPSFWDALSRVRPPTLLLTGSEDEKYVRLARRMAEAIPRAIHRTVEGAGHTVHLEAPELWLQEVMRFLGEERTEP
jgi:2-succinyl-6-hydroxy-2,4-cyclohexadiene-1-carboxylate synthase